MNTLGIALVGCGTVGTGVAQLLLTQAERLSRRAGAELRLTSIVVASPGKPRDPVVPRHLVSADWRAAIADSRADVVVELVGGTTVARQVVLAALEAGKHVVTANKALVAAHGPELFAAARRAGRAVCFEAAVAGGVPIVRALAESLAANQITAIQGILNGTSNYILTRMADEGLPYAEALSAAQQLGYAEADPTLDVSGGDTAHKLAILAQIAFGVTPAAGDIEVTGIAGVQSADLAFAGELGYTLKLLAEAWTDGDAVALHVAPVLVRHRDLLALVRGAANAVLVLGDAVGETMYQGPGAGRMPTASAVVGDLIDLAVGRAQLSFRAANLYAPPSGGAGRYRLQSPERVRSRFYLRVVVGDEPGVLSEVAGALAAESISISSVIQHETPEADAPGAGGAATVALVILTHLAETRRFRLALGRVNKLASVREGVVHYFVDD